MITLVIKIFLSMIINQKFSSSLVIVTNCSFAFEYFFKALMGTDEFKYFSIYICLSNYTPLLGSLIYAELIIFNFCGFNTNVKKNIILREIEEQNKISVINSFDL